MANCPNLVFWSPVPAGSTFKVQASGDQNVFDVTVGRGLNGVQQTPLGFNAIVPGPASQPIAAGDQWSFTPVVALFATPLNPVTLTAWIQDAAGKDVVIAGSGGAASVTLRCQWQFASEGAQMIKILVA